MSHQITQAMLALPEQGFPAAHVNDGKRFGQHEQFFHLALLKNNRAKALRAYFAEHPVRQIVMGGNLAQMGYTHPHLPVLQLDDDYFVEPDEEARQAKCAQLEGCVVVMTNNDVWRGGKGLSYAEFFARCDKTVFVVWDWDNHHWTDNSLVSAVHADLYVPAHHENLYLMTRYNWCTAGPVYAATVQWPRAFLAEQVVNIATAPRSDEPLGMHVAYPAFNFRNRVVSTLSQRFEKIGFSTQSFHARSLQDRFDEWVAHKVHWIVPVLNDVPIRLFDALISGGIPIVPESLRFLPPINQIGREHILFYTPEDVVAPERIVAQAVRMFDEGGLDHVIARHRYALDMCHGSTRVAQMLGFASEKYALGGL